MEFNWPGNLARHKSSIHSGISEFICKPCKRSFRDAYLLTTHNEKCHSNNKSLKTKPNLKRVASLIKTLKKKNFICKKCKRSFKNQDDLKRHISTHKEKSNKCHACENYSESSAAGLSIHRTNVHKGVNYSCKSCDKSYPHFQTLRNHIKNVHLGIYFKCDSCDKSFTNPQNLQTHQKSVHDKIRFNCEKEHKDIEVEPNIQNKAKNEANQGINDQNESAHYELDQDCDAEDKSDQETAQERQTRSK